MTEYRYMRRPNITVDGQTLRVVIPFGADVVRCTPWIEQIEPSFCLESDDVTVRSDGWLVGTTHGKTAQFQTVASGLEMTVIAPQSLPFVVEYCERGDIAGLVIGLEVTKDDWTLMDGDISPVRHLRSGRLVSVNLSTYPADSAVDTGPGIDSLAIQFRKPVDLVTVLCKRNQLWELWVEDKTTAPKRQSRRDPILLGKHGRQAYAEVVGAKDNSSPVLDDYRVTATPADLAKR